MDSREQAPAPEERSDHRQIPHYSPQEFREELWRAERQRSISRAVGIAIAIAVIVAVAAFFIFGR